jgi:hypothetical protein
MDMRRLGLSMLAPAALGFLLVPAHAGASARDRGDRWCDDGGDDERGRFRHCEVREATLTPGGSIGVDARPNGAIRVGGAPRNDVRIRTKVVTLAESEAEARSVAAEVVVRTDGTVRAEGPPQSRHRQWWASFDLSVPARSDLDLTSMNGGITIEDVGGTIAFKTMNGGVSLESVSGDVRGRTTNGGVNVRFAGGAWDGEGLDVSTTNGGVTLTVPEDFSARLETGTVNGQLGVDFPVTLQGRLDRRLALDLGGGGRIVRVTTTNGGVRLRRP